MFLSKFADFTSYSSMERRAVELVVHSRPIVSFETSENNAITAAKAHRVFIFNDKE